MARKQKSKRNRTKQTTARPSPSLCRVCIRETFDELRFETTEVRIVSRFGASFDLSRECRVGTLIQLELPLERELRAFSHDDELYKVIGLIQHSQVAAKGSKSLYEVNVMFIGRHFPDSYFSNPLQAYRLQRQNDDGTWDLTECSSQYKHRRFPRIRIKLQVEIGLIQQNERTILKENTVTCDISSAGVAVISKLPAEVGDKIKFACADMDFYAIAEVLRRRNHFGLQDILHLKFVDFHFPVERLIFSRVGMTAKSASAA